MIASDIFDREPLAVVDGISDFLARRDDYVENYDQIARDDVIKRLMPDEVKEVLLNCCEIAKRPGGTLIDVGAAYGFIVTRLAAARKIAVDIALDYLRLIDPAVTRVRADAEDLPLRDALADCVVCTDVFEHVQDEVALARGLDRILKPGGQLLLATPWQQDLSVYETDEYKTKYAKYKYVHLRSVDDAMIARSFPGFEMISATTIGIGMKHMTLKPYPIRFMNMRKRG
jgi:ubiquinone/menaquinone biosynthesis C-methylase UbiE